MLISVCIPQYNRSKYLLAVLESIRVQDYSEVEVIISDDCSTDDSLEVIPKYIAGVHDTSHVRFNYIRQPKNIGYDGNLRAALGAGHGEYLFILGNDDALPEANTLSKLAEILAKLNYPDISFANFHLSGRPSELTFRARQTAIIGSGPEAALKSFRSFSFVGGITIKRSAFIQYNTAEYDGSIYIQIYLGARTVAAGGVLASIAESLVAKDVEVPGEVVNSYLDTLAGDNRKVHRETGGLDQVGRVACDAILPYVPNSSRQRYMLKIYAQLLCFTYPYWLFTYRKHKVYRAAVNLALGCFPPNLIKVPNVSLFSYSCLTVIFLATTIAGLLVPVILLDRLTGLMSRLSKRDPIRNQSLPGSEFTMTPN